MADKFAELKARVTSLPPATKNLKWLHSMPDWLMARFLQGHRSNVDEALDYLLRTAAWRESYDADGLVDYVESADADARLALLRAHYPMAPLVKDDAGNNVVLLRMAMVDYPGLQKQVGSEMFTKYSVYLQEKNLRVNPNTQTVLIIDLGYSESDTARPIDSMWGVKDWSTAMLAQIKAQSALIEPAYPESFVKIIFTRAPAVFAGIWAMAQLFIAEATAKKFVVLNADDPKPELLKHLPERCVPDFFGGGADTRGMPKGGLV